MNPISQLIHDLESQRKPKKRKPPYVKPDSVKHLEAMNHADRMKRYPSVPNLDYKTFRDDTANNLTNCIVRYIELRGGFASRINSTGSYRPELGRFIKSNSKRGIADIMGTYNGRSLNIEVKIGSDRMSEAQEKVKASIERSGGQYFIAKDFTMFKEWFDGL